MSTKKLPSKSGQKSTKNNKEAAAVSALTFKQRLHGAGRWTVKTMAKLTLALVLFMAIYLIYLDAQVTRKFEGKKWQIPAQIYAKPMTLQLGVAMNKQQLITELEALNYRRVTRLQGAGEYTVSPKHLSVVKRAFDFPGRSEPEKWLTIEFVQGLISRLIDRDSHQAVSRVVFEPLLIERLLSPHHEDREFLPLNAFPEQFKDILLLVEDRDFYHHSGVSLSAIFRALWHNIKAGRTVQGGSTLTQQLAKNVYLNAERSLYRKINEAFIALLLDYRYSKDQILEAYVNEVFLGQFHNRAIHGFGLASHYYFSKPINELQDHEFAVLVGLIKGPSYYNPHKHPERILERRDLVLRLMFEHHLLDKAGYEVAVNQALSISDKKEFKPSRFPAYIAQVKKELKATVRDSALMNNGIKVFTHLDPRIQRAMEKVISEQVPQLELRHRISDAQAAGVSINIANAAINAMVGGADTQFSGLNRARDMRRNIGSLIKPAVYLTALAQPERYALASRLADEPIVLQNQHGQQWSPENFDKTHEGQVFLIDALSRSRNVPTVNLGLALGFEAVTETLQQLGVRQPIASYPSLFLGALELSPLEVTQMYSTLAGGGIYKDLSSLNSVTNSEGEIIWHRNVTARPVLSPEAVYLTNFALHQATRNGTSRVLTQQFPEIRIAGKTGTTDELRDSWFSGFDETNLTTFWLGKDDYSPLGVSGSQGALRLFVELYKEIPGQSIIDVMPEGVKTGYFSPKSGIRHPGPCSGAIQLPTIKDARPEMVDCGL